MQVNNSPRDVVSSNPVRTQGGTELPRILILGASNEIIRNGWVSRLTGHQIENLSIGASSSTAGIFSYLKRAAKAADLAILSYEMNEAAIAKQGLLSDSEIRENWTWLVSRMRQDGTTPIILILPRAVNHKIITTVTRDLQREIAKDLGVALLDFSSLFVEAVENGCPAEALMKDNAHMTIPASEIVGDFIRQSVDLLLQSPKEHRYSKNSATDFYVRWMQEHAQDLPLITRSTSVTSAQLVQVKDGQSVTLPCSDKSKVAAMVLNRLAPGGFVKIGDTRKQMSFCNGPQDVGKFMSVVCDFAEGSMIAGTALTFKVEGSGPVIEPSHMAKEIAEGYDPMIEIEAVLFKTPTATPPPLQIPTHGLPEIDFMCFSETRTILAALGNLSRSL